ncbi:EEF1A lysine methyltransferase 3-like [Heterodontus francisci]|uniref:EEF1A lysine methyltransferase 3-like n=1 Tax=Heterodontus francisci TaxID=7792 RepID=UPI00355B3C46
MASLLRKPITHISSGTHGFTYKLSYSFCGFILEIGVKSVSNQEFGTVVWDAVSLIIKDDIRTLVRKYQASEKHEVGSALGLCQYFEEQKMSFSQKKVIELGAGTGILSILTVLLGGDVTITDKPQLLKQIEQNVSINIPSSFRPRVKIHALSWGYDHTLFPSEYDYILGTDIMYTRASVPLILKTLQHLSNEKTVIYFASKMSIGCGLVSSGYETLSQYFDSDLVYRYENKDVNLYRMRKKAPNVETNLGSWNHKIV